MELVYVSVTLLSLLTVGHSAPVTNCESLIQPVEIQRDKLLDKWNYVAESTNISGSEFLTKMLVESRWVEITAGNENDTLHGFFYQKTVGRCFTFSLNYTLVNNTIFIVHPIPSSGTLLTTGCPDCLVFHYTQTIGRSTYRGLQLFSKRRMLNATELEEFKKQTECLNLSKPVFMDPKKDLCPETVTTDLTKALKLLGPKMLETFNDMINSESGHDAIIKHLSSSILGSKEN